jgi:TolB-like protein
MYHPMVALVAIVLFFVATMSNPALADEPPAPNGSRNFYKVLDEVLSDFEYDLKAGQVLGLKDLAVRNIATSENVPGSFKSHLELLLTERILKTTKTRIVHCIACRSKKTVLDGQNMTITTPDSNSSEMQRIAKMNGIQNFMDVAFAYQPAGMMLSIQISDAETGTALWSRNYNSDTTRASAQRRGVDYQEVEDAKTKMEYQPTTQFKPTIYTLMAPKAGSGMVTALGFGFRMMERYDNRHKEVGFEMNYYMPISTLTGGVADAANVWSSFNLTMLFMHAWGLFGDEENYNQTRGVIHAGIGGSYASGFLGGLIRAGYEWRFAKHWALTSFIGYRPSATILISGTATSLSGVEGGLGVGFIY